MSSAAKRSRSMTNGFAAISMAKMFLVLMSIVVALAACSSNPPMPTPTTAAPGSQRAFKGWELYSWQAGGEWRFALVPGTNRNKTVEEIKTGPQVAGVEAIKAQLAGLARGEEVFWATQGPDYARPPQNTVAAVKDFCESAGLTLHLAGEN